MRISKASLIFCFPLMTAVPAVADQPTPNPAQAETRLCRRIVPTGSVIPKRFCLTKADWEKLSAMTQADADNVLRHRGSGMCDIQCQ